MGVVEDAISAAFATISNALTAAFNVAIGIAKAYLLGLIDGLTSAIDDINAQIKITKHNLSVALGDWLSQGDNVVLFALALIVGIPLLIEGIDAVVALPIYQAFTAWLALEKTNLGVLLGESGFEVFATLNKISLALIPQYAQVMAKLNTAIGSLAAELEVDAGYITSLLQASAATMHLANVLSGGTLLTAQWTKAQQAATVLHLLQDNFDRYAHNPQLIIDDIDQNIVYPALQDATDTFHAQIAGLKAVTDFMNSGASALFVAQDSYNAFIDGLPDEIHAAIETRWADVNTALTDFRNNDLQPFLTQWNTAFGIVRDAVALHDQKILALQQLAKSPSSLALSLHLLSPQARAYFERVLSSSTSSANRLATLGMYGQAKDTLAPVEAAPDLVELSDTSVPSTTQESQIMALQFPTQRTDRTSWFSGEY